MFMSIGMADIRSKTDVCRVELMPWEQAGACLPGQIARGMADMDWHQVWTP